MPTFFSAVLLVLFSLAPCHAGPAMPSKRLRVMAPLLRSATFDHVLNDVVRDFNVEQGQSGKNIQVELLERGDSFETLRAVIASHYANDLPDLAMVSVNDIPTLEALHILQPLPEKWFASKKILPHLSTAVRCEAKPCSMPFQRRVPVWFYNQELLFKLNLETQRIPSSISQLIALAAKIKKSASSMGELWPLIIPCSGEPALARWNALGLSPLVSPIDTPALWMDRMRHLPQDWLGLIAPGHPSAVDATRIFLEQKAVILVGQLPLWNNLHENAVFKFGTVLPDAKDLAWVGTDFVVMAKDGHAALAREFLDYLYRPEIALRFQKVAATLPVSRAYLEDPAWKLEIDRWPLLKSIVNRPIKSLNADIIPPNLRDEWVTIVWQAVERGESTAELKVLLQKLLSTKPH